MIPGSTVSSIESLVSKTKGFFGREEATQVVRSICVVRFSVSALDFRFYNIVSFTAPLLVTSQSQRCAIPSAPPSIYLGLRRILGARRSMLMLQR